MQLSLQAYYGRPFLLSRLHREVSLHCRCKLVSVSDFKGDVFSCVGRLRRVLCACSEKGVCRQYRPSPLCISCIYLLLASMAVLFQESSALLCGSFSFQMCSLSDVADDLWLSLKLDVSHLLNTNHQPHPKEGDLGMHNDKMPGRKF